MMTLDELVAADAAHRAKVAACEHAFTKVTLGDHLLGRACEHCGTPELVWLRGEVERLTHAATAFEFSGPGGRWWVRPLNEHGVWTIGLPGWLGGERFSRQGAIDEARRLAATAPTPPTVTSSRGPQCRCTVIVNDDTAGTYCPVHGDQG